MYTTLLHTHTHTLVHADSVYNALLNVWVCIRRAMLHYNMVCLYSFVFVLFFNIMWSHDKWTNRNTSNQLVIQSCLSAEWSAKIQFINKMIWEEVFVLEVIKSGVFLTLLVCKYFCKYRSYSFLIRSHDQVYISNQRVLFTLENKIVYITLTVHFNKSGTKQWKASVNTNIISVQVCVLDMYTCIGVYSGHSS